MTEQTPETGKQEDLESRGADEQQESSAPESADTADNNGQPRTLEQALEKLAEAEAVMASHQTEVLRLHADMQNIRRRAEQDVEKAHKYGQEKLVSELLPVIDNLERALQATDDQEDQRVSALRQGVELTLKSLVGCLQKFNVEPLDPIGEPFNPEFHQAMGMMESATAEPDSVTAVMQKGYTLNGRVLRPAMVMVARAPAGDGVDVKA